MNSSTSPDQTNPGSFPPFEGNPPSPIADATQRAFESARQAGQSVQQAAQEWSETAKAKSAELIAAQNIRIDRSPGTAVLEAFVIGLAIGMLIRLLQGAGEKPKIDIKHKPTIEEARFHLGSLLLPFFWPVFKSARRQYKRSVEGVQEAVEQVQETDFRKLGRKSAKKVEQWVDKEVAPIAETGFKKLRRLWQ